MEHPSPMTGASANPRYEEVSGRCKPTYLLTPGRTSFRLGWFSSIKYDIGGQEYSADAIEHGILRGNRPSPTSLSVLLGHPEWSKGYFKKDDPRLKQVDSYSSIIAKAHHKQICCLFKLRHGVDSKAQGIQGGVDGRNLLGGEGVGRGVKRNGGGMFDTLIQRI